MIQRAAIDNRRIEPGDLFIPIRGERFDGHQFIEAALQAGAAAFVADHPVSTSAPWIQVDDTVAALQAAARVHRDAMGPLTTAVTGSAGKTTTKEMIYAVFSRRFRTICTSGNLNNQTGVPLTLFTIRPDTQAAVVEMGMNHVGEIDRIAAAASPDIGVITNIGTAHIEYLGSRQNILAAKCEMLRHVRDGGRVFVNGDDDLLREAARTEKLSTYGIEAGNALRAVNIQERGLYGTDLTVTDGTLRFAVHIPAPGRYMVYAALAAAACGLEAGLSPDEISEGIASYRPAGSRMRVVHKGITILDDTYNANAPAMKAALDVLALADGPKVAVLGEMRELGEASAELHREVVSYAASLPVRLILTVGAGYDSRMQTDDSRILWFPTQEQLLEQIDALVRPGDTILVKASRGMHMEDTVQHLERSGVAQI